MDLCNRSEYDETQEAIAQQNLIFEKIKKFEITRSKNIKSDMNLRCFEYDTVYDSKTKTQTENAKFSPIYCDPGIKQQKCGNIIITSASGNSSRQIGGCLTKKQCENFCNSESVAGSLICRVTCCDNIELCNKPRACKNDTSVNSSCIKNVNYDNIYFAGQSSTKNLKNSIILLIFVLINLT